MIVPGTITELPNGTLQLISPLGFNTTYGIRVSNLSTGTITLSNITETEQSQEYLLAGQQMVYRSLNVRTIPSVTDYTGTAADLVPLILVEWSTDPVEDFTGTYPTSVTGSGGGGGGGSVTQGTVPWVVSPEGGTLPVSAASLPLPTGAATAALQSNVQAVAGSSAADAVAVQGLAGGLAVPVSMAATPSGAATAALQSNVQSAPGTPQTEALTIQGNASGVAVPVAAATLPLPTGAATAALQSNVQAVAGSSAADAIAVQGLAGGLAVPISATALPLPTGAATAANQTATQATIGAAVPASALMQGFDDGTDIQPVRQPTLFFMGRQTVSSGAAGLTALAASASNRYRIFRFKIQISGLASVGSAGEYFIVLSDASNPIYYDQVNLPATSGTGASVFQSGWIDFGENGYLCAAVNRAVGLSVQTASAGTTTALTAGAITLCLAYGIG